MPTIERYLDLSGVFDPETIGILGAAFQGACALVGHTAQPVAVRESIAKAIFETAKLGERDPRRLREVGLKAAEQHRRAAGTTISAGVGSGAPLSR